VRSERSVDVPGAHAAAVTSALLIAQQVAGKAARDALFLSNFRASYLPVVIAVGAVLSLGAVYWLSRVIVRRSPAVVMPLLLAASAVGYTLEWALGFSTPRITALLVYFHTALFGPLLLSAFWSLINERFDPHTAKRAVARIAGGGTLGGVLGGLAVWRASSLVQPGTVLLLLAALNGLALIGTVVTRARGEVSAQSSPPEGQHGEPTVSPFGVLKEAPFLRNVALLVALGTATSAILDYVFGAQAVAVFGKGQALLAFFSLFWLGVGVLSFFLQSLLARVTLEKLGLALSIAVLPGLVMLGAVFGLAVPGLASAAVLRGAEATQRNTLFRSAYELLYTPLPEARKRATKLLIDVGFDRIGTVLGSAVSLVVIGAFAGRSSAILLGCVVVLAVATFPVTRRLHFGYVEALQQGLREGAAKLEVPSDGTSVRATGAPGREQLIEQIEALQPGGLSALSKAEGEPAVNAPTTPALDALRSPDSLLSAAQELLSTDLDRARKALARLRARGPEVTCAIFLLAHRELHEPALQALSGVAASIPGQLLDALLDPELDFAVRRKIPRILRHCSTQRVAEGLLLAIDDDRFEIRYECGRALLALTEGSSEIVISEQRTLEAIRREVEGGQQILETLGTESEAEAAGDEQQSSLVDGLLRDRVDRSLEHVFTILCLHLERAPLRLAFRALHHVDTRHRGTALEYLDTVLPAEIRELVWPLLREAAPLPSARATHELLADMALVGQSA
jgi:ATP:ADP antiporter, AAA family